MTDLLDAAETSPTGAATPDASWSAPSGSPGVPSSPVPPPPSAVPAIPAPTLSVAAPPSPATVAAPTETPLVPEVPAFPIADRQPRQNGSQIPVGSSGPLPGTLPGTFPVDLSGLQPTTVKPLVRWGSIVKTVFWICALAGLACAGIVYGPEYYERYFGEEPIDAVVGTSIADEPPAPLAFPAAIAAPAIAAATFEVIGSGPNGPVTYEVTTDFASAAAQTFVTRPGAAPLEVLTVGDQALIRRTGDSTWYRTARGSFPFNGTIDRAQWVRLVDELFPTEIRGVATIEAASHSAVEGVPARRLVVSVPTGRLAPPPSLPSLRGQFGLEAEASASTVEVGAAPPSENTADTASPAAQPAPPAPSTAAPQATDVAPGTTPAPSLPTTQLEIWVDDAGVVRQAISDEVFGVERLTVTSTMAAAWAPTLPAEDVIRPLDADAAVFLGL